MNSVACEQAKIALRYIDLFAALNGANERFYLDLMRERGERYFVERTALVYFKFHELGSAARKNLYFQRRREDKYAAYFLCRDKLGIYGDVYAEIVFDEVYLLVIFGITHSGGGAPGTELFCHQA